MVKTCKYCGKEYNGDPGSSCCPDCAAEQRKTSVRLRVCTVCGTTFLGGPAARYCPTCRAQRRRENDRRYKRNGSVRKLGSVDICKVCGGEYVVANGKQKYCPKCAPEAIRALDNAKSREWNAANTTPEGRKRERQEATAPIPCKVCGKPFVPRTAAVTCSPECSRLLEKQNRAAWEKANSAHRNEWQQQWTKKKVDAMTPEEQAEYRAQINAQARKNYKKRMERMTPDEYAEYRAKVNARARKNYKNQKKENDNDG